jgi:hypothetical protein
MCEKLLSIPGKCEIVTALAGNPVLFFALAFVPIFRLQKNSGGRSFGNDFQSNNYDFQTIGAIGVGKGRKFAL